MLKVIFCFIFSLVFTKIFVQYYWAYVPLSLYPLFQIYHNTYNVVSKNCFIWKIHFLMFFPVLYLPYAMRFEFFDFFELKSDIAFCMTLLGITLGLLFFMLLQRYLGRCFFLPKCLNTNYFSYKRKVADLEQ